jgi:hypothetical protein
LCASAVDAREGQEEVSAVKLGVVGRFGYPQILQQYSDQTLSAA